MIKNIFFSIFCLLLFQTANSQAPIFTAEAIHHPIVAKNGMVASQHYLASRVGLDILEQGGNAVDAAVAVGFSLAVVLPRAGNLGGGGFMLLYDSERKKTSAINYRETAPALSSRDMFLNEAREVDNTLFNQSYKSIGIPGTVAGLLLAHEKFGSLPLNQILAPAIQLARKGFPISHDLSRVLVNYEQRLKKCENTKKIFYKNGQDFYEPGDTLKQEDLAWSISQISQFGKDAFYKGEIGKKICEDIKKNGGILEPKDFENYEALLVDVVSSKYKSYQIQSMPPPSSGGIHIIQMLNILEGFPIRFLGHNSAELLHIMAETMKLAYADRSEHLGDPLFWEVPVEGLASQDYADVLREKIDLRLATPSEEISPGEPKDFESNETTHFSVVDKYGNIVSNTYTLNFSFGTGLVADGTGILLNNEMADFSAKPGEANAFGLLGGSANAVEAGKRPLSSMTPVIVLKDDKPFLVTGSPGGSRIITALLQLLLNVMDHDMNIAEATHAPRVHHQWYPDTLYFEKGISPDTQFLLTMKGHHLRKRNAMGSTQSIVLDNGFLYGASDPRRPDARTFGY